MSNFDPIPRLQQIAATIEESGEGTVPGWIVFEAVPSTNPCVDILEIRVRLLIIGIGVASNKQTA